MKKKNKRKLLILGSLVALLTYSLIEYKYNPNYEVLETCDDAYIRYSNGKVFIGSEQYLRNLTDLQDGDILVEDLRDASDPNFRIYDSYKVKDKNDRDEILEILCRYEECHPSNWNRTIESMRLEWLMHNISYYFNYDTKRTTDVDLNNNDELLYNDDLIKKY